MFITMTDEPETAESSRIPVSNSELKAVEENLEIIELKAINRMLIAACWDATQLRGIWTALNDPLALDMEKRKLRERYKQIEIGIRATIDKAEARMK